MTKKHYIAIADAINFSLKRGKYAPEVIAHRLAEYFKSENPKFNRSKFLTACGIEQK